MRVSRHLYAPTTLHFRSEQALSKQRKCIGGWVCTRAELDVMMMMMMMIMMMMINLSVLAIRRAVVVLPETIKLNALLYLRS
jgi:hypothetical protein